MMINERKEFMQETQHTQQTLPGQHKTKTRKQHECKCLQKHRRHTETNKHLLITWSVTFTPNI